MEVEVEVEVMIKMGEKEVILGSDEAKELYFKLKQLYDREVTYVPYPLYKRFPVYPIWDPYTAYWETSSTTTYSAPKTTLTHWETTAGNVSLSAVG